MCHLTSGNGREERHFIIIGYRCCKVAIDAVDGNSRHVLSQLLFDVHDSQIVIIESMEVAYRKEVLGRRGGSMHGFQKVLMVESLLILRLLLLLVKAGLVVWLLETYESLFGEEVAGELHHVLPDVLAVSEHASVLKILHFF